MKCVAFIPARYFSTRFPHKPLAQILGKPMICWVAELTAKAVGHHQTYVATDHQAIASVVEAAGFQVVMTSPDALTGTDRIAEASRKIEADLYINVQGDEPMLDPASILRVVEAASRHPGEIINAYAPLGAGEDPNNVNIPKCVVSRDGRLLYMSRAAIPSYKDPASRPSEYLKQVCIYAFTSDHLDAFSFAKVKGAIESSEDIEILRFLELGIPVRMIELPGHTLAVDTPEDIALVEQALRNTGDME